MRIIGGKNKGRKLQAPKGTHTRPTSDRVREALFNIITHRIPGCSFLDIYAGSGAVGIEAAGRGAKEVFFVENHRAALDVLRKNLEATDLKAQILAMSAAKSIDILAANGACFDVIFMDPPYREAESALKLGSWIAQKGLMTRDGVLVLEFGLSHFQPGQTDGLDLFDQRRYGDTGLAFYRMNSLDDCADGNNISR